MTHWREQLSDRGVVAAAPASAGPTPMVRRPETRSGCGGNGRRGPAATVGPGGKLSFDLVVVNWLRIMHGRITWSAVAVWVVRLPLRVPLRMGFWLSRQWLKWKLRRHAERGPRADVELVRERQRVCAGCDRFQERNGMHFCGACQCPKRPRSSLERKWGMANYRCPVGKWSESYPKWHYFALSVLNEACPTCAKERASNG